MIHPSASTATPAILAAYVSTDQGAEVARAVAAMMGANPAVLHGGGLSGAARVSTGTAIANTVLTEMGNMPLDAACESVSEICKSGANVVVLGGRSDLSIYRALRNAGASEYFAFPVTAEEIIAANIQAAPSSPASQPIPLAPSSTCIGVMGCTGGVGASLLAQSLAFHAASPKGPALQTALIDADLRFGTQAIDLDRNDTPGLQEALSAPDRVDPTFLAATMEPLNDRLALYSQPSRGFENVDQLEASFAPLIQSMKGKFGALVVDLPRTTLVAQPELARKLDTLVLVIPAGYAGVNVASRLMALLKTEAPDLKILPVLSEFRQDAKLTAKDLAKAIHQDVAAILPDSGAIIHRAHRAAKPVIESQPRSAYAKATRHLWALAVADHPAPAQKTKRRFFKRTPS